MSIENPSGETDIPLAQARTFIASHLRALDQVQSSTPDAVNSSGTIESQQHLPLSHEVQSIVSTGVIRMAGFDHEGKFLGVEKLLQDLKTAHLIESDLVIDPADVADQLHALKKARAAETANTPEQLQNISSFAALGGHANLNSISTLLDVIEKRGYVLLLEYTVDGKAVPGGTIYGFAQSFDSDSRFPTLGIDSLGIVDEKKAKLREKKDRIVTNWRTSVPRGFKSLQDKGFDIPERLLGAGGRECMSPRHWGGGNALKLGVAAMAEKQEAETLTLNVGTIEEVDDNFGVDSQYHLPNVASEKYNSGFLQRSAYPRNVLSEVVAGSPGGIQTLVANIRWSVYHSTVPQAIARLEAENGVLRAKGGWDVENIHECGHTAGNISHEFMTEIAQQARLPLARSENLQSEVSPTPEQ